MTRSKQQNGDVGEISVTSRLGTIKQTLNGSFINRVNEPRINVHHSKRKSNDKWNNFSSCTKEKVREKLIETLDLIRNRNKSRNQRRFRTTNRS